MDQWSWIGIGIHIGDGLDSRWVSDGWKSVGGGAFFLYDMVVHCDRWVRGLICSIELRLVVQKLCLLSAGDSMVRGRINWRMVKITEKSTWGL